MVVTDQQEVLLTLGNSTYFDAVSLAEYTTAEPWPEEDESVDRVAIDHVIEYLDGPSRIVFFNELHRVLKPGGKVSLKVPYWASPNAYADPYLAWPPITELSIPYLADAEFRERNQLHYDGLEADFDLAHGYSYAPEWYIRSDATREYAHKYNIGVVTQLVYALVKK